MTIEEAKKIPIEDYLSSIGFNIRQTNDRDIWVSIRADDKTPSCKINTQNNTWRDFGLGKGGDLIELVKYLNNCDFHQAMLEIENRTGTISSLPTKEFKETADQQSSLVFLKQKKIFSFPLKNYLEGRGISLEVANRYLKEIEFELKGKKQFGLGLANDKGGFEIRNPLLKTSIGEKAISTINPGMDKVAIFEGMFDFLSFITEHPKAEKAYTFKVLNTVSFINYDLKEDNYKTCLNKLSNVFKEELKEVNKEEEVSTQVYKNVIDNLPYKEYHLLLDNDSAGDKAFDLFKEVFASEIVKDQRGLFEGYEDYNAYLTDKIENQNIKKRL